MKTVLLQMEDEAYEMLMKKIQKIANAEKFRLNSAELQNIAYMFLALVEKAKPFDELANGEVMQTMFPQMNIISASPFSVYIEMKECNQFNNLVSFDVDWWNRKWGE